LSARAATSPLDLLDPPLSGVNLIEASAGTGKTYAIAAIYLHLVMGKALPVDAILVVTFTVAATEELKGRIRAMLRKAHRAFTARAVEEGDKDRALMAGLLSRYGAERETILERLTGALRDFDRAAIFTIHGFCQRMLQDNAFESSALFETELLADDAEILEEVAGDFWRSRMYGASEAVARYAAANDVSPEGLIGLLERRPLDPRTRIVPRPQKPDISSIEKNFAEAVSLFAEASGAWRAARGEISALLLAAVDEKRLHGGRIRKDSLGDRLAEMDEFFSGGDPFAAYKNIGYFTSSHINDTANKGKTAPRHAFLELWQRFNDARDSLESLARDWYLVMKTEFLDGAPRLLEAARERRNARTFDDLLSGMHRALRGDAGSPLALAVRGKFRAALIDEFQDTDPLQYEIFSTAFGRGGTPLFMIGDPKQAIYRFRGADIFAYLRAAADCDRRWSLAENHRSNPGLVKAVNTVFTCLASRTDRPFVLEGIGFTEVRPARDDDASGAVPLTIWFIDEAHADNMTSNGRPTGKVNKGTAVDLAARHTAAEIARLLDGGETAANIAVLVRKHHQADVVTGYLRALGVPCVSYGTESVFETREALELERVLAAVAEPSDTGLVNAALATEFWGKSAAEIARASADDEEAFRVSASFAEYRTAWEKGGFMPMFSAMLRDLAVRTRLISFEDGERRLTNVLHLGEVLHRAEQGEGLGAEGLLKWLRGRRAEADRSEETKIRLETDEKAVRVITMHKSKGLEFPVVFCPCLFDAAELRGASTYHDPEDGNRPVLDLGASDDEGAAGRARALAEELSESMRLLYVALTRAKRRCYIAWGRINDTSLSAPFYAFHHHRVADWDAFLAKSSDRKLDLTHQDMFDDLRDLAEASDGTIVVTVLPPEEAPRYRAAASAARPECREFRGDIRRRWSLTSFSSLVFNAAEWDDGRDRDSSAPAEHEPALPGQSVHGFPRGTRAGNVIHAIFEEIDFADPSSPASRDLISSCLERHRFGAEWRGTMEQMAHNVLSASLDGGSLCLSEIGAEDRLHELEFYFPAAGITPAGLAGIILEGRKDLPAAPDDIIARLGLDTVNGFVRGFIDLVFRRDGRYYILDWKSNHLGNSADDYTEERMSGAMTEHLYHLQYHIYAVALHRYLRRTLPGYRYDAHFGGAFYLFVRGVDPGAPGRGVFFDRPSAELMERLDAYVAGGGNVG